MSSTQRAHASSSDLTALLPDEAEVRGHLDSILARGSVNLGEGAGTERLMLMLTRSCELRCGYCFIRKSEVGPEMPEATARAAIDLLMRSQRPRLELQLFGGEPTRAWPALEAAVLHAVHHPARGGRRLELMLTTNGLGLDADRIAWLGERGAMVLLSIDGDAGTHRRFRPVHHPSAGDPANAGAAAPTGEAAWARIDAVIEQLLASQTPWFMNATVPPAAADTVHTRYVWARERGVPRLQLNYAVGMSWNLSQRTAYLTGLVQAMREHRRAPGGMVLFNWRSECEPVMLSDDLIVDVDGTVLHDGALFLERAFPELRATYRRGHVHELLASDAPFDPLRWSLTELAKAMRSTYPPSSEQHRTIVQNIELGAAVDLVIRRLRTEGGDANGAGGAGVGGEGSEGGGARGGAAGVGGRAGAGDVRPGEEA